MERIKGRALEMITAVAKMLHRGIEGSRVKI